MKPNKTESNSSFSINPNFWTLAILMAATRLHHYGSAYTLPDASIAVFFLGGLWLSKKSWFWVLILQAVLLDLFAIYQFNVSNFCLTPAYFFLLPTYAVMWWGGVWNSKKFNLNWKSSIKNFLFGLTLSTLASYLISNLSFNAFSGRYQFDSWQQIFAGTWDYLPSYFLPVITYVVMLISVKHVFKVITDLKSVHTSA